MKEKSQEIILIRNTIVKNDVKQVNKLNQSLESIFEKLIGRNIDTIEDRKTGFFYDLGNPIMAAKKIKLILNNENLMKEIGLRSKLRQKNLFDSKKMAEEYQKIYKSFI